MEAQLRIYDWQSDEYLLIDWYNALVTSGDHYLAFDKELRYLSRFLDYFKPPRTLAYATDRGGIWFAFFLDPWLSGANLGFWVREDKRHSGTMFGLFKRCINEAFKFATVLIIPTKQEHVGNIMLKLGAKYGMTIPALWDGADVAIYTLSRDKWKYRNEDR